MPVGTYVAAGESKSAVLMIHGLNDQALVPGRPQQHLGVAENDLTLVTMVTRSMKMWLNR